MLTAEENAQLTRVGPGTLMGELMRRYWIPVVQSSAAESHMPPGFELITAGNDVLSNSAGAAALAV